MLDLSSPEFSQQNEEESIDPEIIHNIEAFKDEFDGIICYYTNESQVNCHLYNNEEARPGYEFIIPIEQLPLFVKRYKKMFEVNFDPSFLEKIDSLKDLNTIVYEISEKKEVLCSIYSSDLSSGFTQLSVPFNLFPLLKDMYPSIQFFTKYEYVENLIKTNQVNKIKVAKALGNGGYWIVPYSKAGFGFGQFTLPQEEFERLEKQFADLVGFEIVENNVKKEDNFRKFSQSEGKKIKTILLQGHKAELKLIGFKRSAINDFKDALSKTIFNIDDSDLPEDITRDDIIKAVRAGISATIEKLKE